MNRILTTQECKVLYNYGKTHNGVFFSIIVHLLHLKNVYFNFTELAT